MRARLWKPRHQAWLMAEPLVESVLLDSEPPVGSAKAAALVRHKEPPERQRRREQIRLESASSQ